MGQIFVRASRRAKAYVRGTAATMVKAQRLENKIVKKIQSGGIARIGHPYNKTLDRRYRKVKSIRLKATKALYG